MFSSHHLLRQPLRRCLVRHVNVALRTSSSPPETLHQLVLSGTRIRCWYDEMARVLGSSSLPVPEVPGSQHEPGFTPSLFLLYHPCLFVSLFFKLCFLGLVLKIVFFHFLALLLLCTFPLPLHLTHSLYPPYIPSLLGRQHNPPSLSRSPELRQPLKLRRLTMHQLVC